MDPQLEKVERVMLHYARLFRSEYHEKWIPAPEHIEQTVRLFKSPMPGFEGYSPEDLVARLETFFKIKEDWVVSCKHNYSVFTKHIHRWLPKPVTGPKPAPAVAKVESFCPDCHEPIKPGDICRVCYPHCAKCDQYHAPEDDCEEFAARMKRTMEMLSNSSHRAGKTKQIGDFLR